ncbi:MAG: inorganic phosphate transporter [Rickettsiales bacterium]|nr:inorganic phosphate transporter [Rickettsiales bacterium]MCA0254435.1 inorganic phosphate transporter [Pseudomonadota bacterium]
MEYSLGFILFVIGLAFVFDFTNGFHDAGNSIATIVATRVLTPIQAVIWAAFFNFIAFLFFKLSVAHTIGTGLIDTEIVSPALIFAALLSAVIWNILTWYFGLPSSSSHALIGGIVGAAVGQSGVTVLKMNGLIKVLSAIILSPLIGILIGILISALMIRLTKYWSETIKNRCFKLVQLLSSAMLSLSHGGNDAQKTMGIISLLLYSASLQEQQFTVPFWVVISCNAVIGIGTLCGGWRIIYTMARKITTLDPVRASCAETGAAIVIFSATYFGLPVSTTHTVTGAIAGVGVSSSFWSTNWKMMNRIFLTWAITIPATSLIAISVTSLFNF